MYNDVFLSYRHDTGIYLTQIVNKSLSEKGISCFYDNNSIHNEDFLKKMREGVEGAPNFVGILTPGFFKRREGVEDYVRKELEWALELKKNIIFIQDEDFDFNEVDWDKEDEEFKKLKYINTSIYHRDANDKQISLFFNETVDLLVDSKGDKLTLERKNHQNFWYGEIGGMTDEDKIWILTDHEVNKRFDWDVLGMIVKEDIFKNRKKLNLLSYQSYDIETYKDKYDISKFSGLDDDFDKTLEVYGVTYPELMEEAEEAFGKGHYIAINDDIEGDSSRNSHLEKVTRLLKLNKIKGYDIIDLTLVIKDTEKPDKTVKEVAKLLNPEGGIILIRELDDDYLDAFPDKENYIPKLKKFLELDRGAGNRHCGKRVLAYLKRAGADRIHFSDRVLTTANHKAKYNQKLCDTYFSYLIPEFRYLMNKPEEEMDEIDKRNRNKYKEAYLWLEDNYDDIRDLFGSDEFYFRAGYVVGYGVFLPEDEE